MGPFRSARAAWLFATLWVAGCAGGANDAPPTHVFASASLAAPFAEIQRAFEARHPGVRVELVCAGTPQLVLQIREGAPADVFASADEKSLEDLARDGHLAAPAHPFAQNRLAIVTAAGNPKGLAKLADLARSDVTLVLCAPDVPAGRYARRALEAAGVAVRSVSDEPSVRAVVAKVRLGEVDAGIVYATDGAAGVDCVPLPEAENVVATDPIAVLRGGENPDGGADFVAFVLSDAGQSILRAHGFAAP